MQCTHATQCDDESDSSSERWQHRHFVLLWTQDITQDIFNEHTHTSLHTHVTQDITQDNVSSYLHCTVTAHCRDSCSVTRHSHNTRPTEYQTTALCLLVLVQPTEWLTEKHCWHSITYSFIIKPTGRACHFIVYLAPFKTNLRDDTFTTCCHC